MDQTTLSLALTNVVAARSEAEGIHKDLSAVVGEAPPFGMYPLLRHFGLRVVEWSFPERISGCMMRTDKGDYAVGINRNHSPARRRFSAAHELYHYLNHRHLLPAAVCTYPSPQFEELEREANFFAAELLMPKAWVWHYCGRMYVREMALVFGVSLPALHRRLLELGLRSRMY